VRAEYLVKKGLTKMTSNLTRRDFLTLGAGVTMLDLESGSRSAYGSTATSPANYYGQKDLPILSALATGYTTFDNYFCAMQGTSNDYHPKGSVLVAEQFVARVHDALKDSPQWGRMVFVLNFDEHGGFFDHVPPPACKDDTVRSGPGPFPPDPRNIAPSFG
jgi:hypothetical protein